MSKRIILGTVLSTATVFSLLWFFWSSEEDLIRVQFDELSGLVSKIENSSPISDALALKNFSSLFCEEIVLETGNSSRLKGKYTNQELVRSYGRLRSYAKTIDLRFEVLQFVSLDHDGAKVSVRVWARATEKAGKKHSENFQAEVLLRKREGEWRFATFAYLGP